MDKQHSDEVLPSAELQPDIDTKDRIHHKKPAKKSALPLTIILFFILFSLFAIRGLTINTNTPSQRTVIKAAPDDAVLSFAPTSLSIPPGGSVALMLDAKTHQVAFAMVKLSFDPTKVQLTQEIQTNPGFQSVVSKSTIAEANSTGTIVIALAIFDPIKFTTPPPAQTGMIQFAQMTFAARSGVANDSVILRIVPDGVQIADANNTQTAVAFTHAPITIRLNPTSSTSTPTGSAYASATPTYANTVPPTRTPTETRPPFQNQTATPTPPRYSNFPTSSPRPTRPEKTHSPRPTRTPMEDKDNDLAYTGTTDVNGDGCVDQKDVNVFMRHLRRSGTDQTLNLNNDNKIDVRDMFAILSDMGKGCKNPNRFSFFRRMFGLFNWFRPQR